jgi:nucleoid DNA-binding protein
MTMTKMDVIRAVAQASGVSQVTTEKVIETLLETVQDNIAAGNRVEIRGFAIFETKIAKARIGRNPSDPNAAPIPIPARPVLRFKIGKNLKDAVNRNAKPT